MQSGSLDRIGKLPAPMPEGSGRQKTGLWADTPAGKPVRRHDVSPPMSSEGRGDGTRSKEGSDAPMREPRPSKELRTVAARKADVRDIRRTRQSEPIRPMLAGDSLRCRIKWAAGVAPGPRCELNMEEAPSAGTLGSGKDSARGYKYAPSTIHAGSSEPSRLPRPAVTHCPAWVPTGGPALLMRSDMPEETDRSAPCVCGHPRWMHSTGDYLHSPFGDAPLTDGPCGGMNKEDTGTCSCQRFVPADR